MYKIKPEYLDLWGDNATETTVISQEDLEMIARGREKAPEELMPQLIPVSKQEIDFDATLNLLKLIAK